MKLARRTLAAFGVLLVLAGTALTGAAWAQTGPPPPFVTDYAAYPDTPQAQLPAGCDSTGILGPQFFLNGAGPFAALPALPAFHAGDTLTMTWTGVTPSCVGAPVALTVKHATQPFFDVNAIQPAVPPYGLTIATAGAGTVSLVLPDLSTFDANCFVQIDAIVGIPLATVAKLPNGSFYSASTRGDAGRTTLISFNNGSYDVCAAQQTTTTTGSTTTTTPSSTTTPTSTTTPSSTTSTTGGTTTTTRPPSSTTTIPTTTTTTRVLAATGLGLDGRALGAVLVVIGLVCLVLSLRFARTPREPRRQS